MKILMYENRKCDPTFYDASTPEKELEAYYRLFKELDEGWQVYDCGDLSKRSSELLEKARKGDKLSAKLLLRLRRNFEYEEVQECEVIDPCE